MKRIVALLLSVIIITNTFTYTNQKAYATEVVAGAAITELVALIMSACGAGFTAYLADQGFTGDLTTEELVTILTVHFAVKVIGGKFVIESKETGDVYTPSTPINWDMLNSTMEEINNSTGGKIISYIDGNVGVSLDTEMKQFLTWWKTNVRIKDGNYQVLTRVSTMGYTYDEWVDVTELQLMSYIPYVYREEYVIMKNGLREVSGAISSAYINSQIGIETTNNTTYNDLADMFKWNTAYGGERYEYILSQYRPSNGKAYIMTSTKPLVRIKNSTYYFGPKDTHVKKYVVTGESYESFEERYLDSMGGMGLFNSYNITYVNYDVLEYQIIDGSYQPNGVVIAESMEDSSQTGGNYVIPKVIIPAIALGETGIAVGFDDVVELPVEEDEEGVPVAVDHVPGLTVEEVFEGVTEGEIGVPATTTEGLLAQIYSQVGSIVNNQNNNNYQKQQVQLGFDDLVQLLKDKLGLFFQLQDFLYDILHAGYSGDPPEFTITFTGQYGVHGTYTFLDLSFYNQYRDYIHLFIASIAWFMFIKKMYKRIPNLITT